MFLRLVAALFAAFLITSGALSNPPEVQASTTVFQKCLEVVHNKHPRWSLTERKQACTVSRHVTKRVNPKQKPGSMQNLELTDASDEHNGILGWETGNLFWQFTTTVYYHWEPYCVFTEYGCIPTGGYSYVIDNVECSKDYVYLYALSIDNCGYWPTRASKDGWTFFGYSVGADFTVNILDVTEGQKTRGFWWTVETPGLDPPGSANPYCCKNTSRWK